MGMHNCLPNACPFICYVEKKYNIIGKKKEVRMSNGYSSSPSKLALTSEGLIVRVRICQFYFIWPRGKLSVILYLWEVFITSKENNYYLIIKY